MNAHSLDRLLYAVLDPWSRDWKAMNIERLSDHPPNAPLMPWRRNIFTMIRRFDARSA